MSQSAYISAGSFDIASFQNQLTKMKQRFNGLTLVAFTLMILGGFSLLADRSETTLTYAAAGPVGLSIRPSPTFTPFQPLPTPLPAVTEMILLSTPEGDPPDRPEDIRLPYDRYYLTQGTHGAAYGDAAIDLTAGNGADILAPINGQVTLNDYDQWGNTVLVIENEVWQVRLLHGDFYPREGAWVGIGKLVGAESNHGYTVDFYGWSCRGRKCGYHTHMNVFDKRTGQNADLIELLNP
jgi:murein DD-endopeptidase MepM/ murein hydrolase activator NlpD